MFQFQSHKSQIDDSVNYTIPYGKSMVECRFVQRKSDQIVVYVSSQNGCKMACRFCHLTQTGQTEMEDVTPELFTEQMKVILYNHQNSIIDNVRCNVNFMARGEPLENQFIINNWNEISERLLKITGDFGIYKNNVKFNVSTIIPKSVVGTATEMFKGCENTWLYWSYYSHQIAFRKRWMPNASTIERCLEFIGDYPRVVVHGAFIKNENDKIDNLVNMLKEHPHWRMNIVRYNPFSPKQGSEADNINEILLTLDEFTKTQIIQRVGFDQACSCGMFLNSQ